MKDIDLSSLKDFKKYLKPFNKIARQHYFIISMLLILALSGVIYTVTQRVNTVVEVTDDEPQQALIRFDQQTIKVLESLNEETGGYQPPSNKRINPFAE